MWIGEACDLRHTQWGYREQLGKLEEWLEPKHGSLDCPSEEIGQRDMCQLRPNEGQISPNTVTICVSTNISVPALIMRQHFPETRWFQRPIKNSWFSRD